VNSVRFGPTNIFKTSKTPAMLNSHGPRPSRQTILAPEKNETAVSNDFIQL